MLVLGRILAITRQAYLASPWNPCTTGFMSLSVDTWVVPKFLVSNQLGSGDLLTSETSAFDPIFFLHHANVDRLLSLWSAVHPGEWVSPGPAQARRGSFTIRANAALDSSTGMPN
jgi:hypothetical protein